MESWWVPLEMAGYVNFIARKIVDVEKLLESRQIM
jgi:hypothetical protein